MVAVSAPSAPTRPDTPEAAADPGAAAGEASLLVGRLGHRRRGPRPHRFELPVFYLWLDVDAIDDTFDRLPLWSSRRPAPVRFRRRDHLDGSLRPLGDAVRELVAARTGRRPTGPIRLLTQPRLVGWLFNPLSVYWCFAPDGTTPETIVLEVTNTPWHERTWYVIEVDPARPGGPWTFAKAMHVSPFLGMDLRYRLRAAALDEQVVIRLQDLDGDVVVLDAELDLHRLALDRRSALTIPLRYPLQTLRVSASIYLHALRLWRKGVPVHRHPDPVDGAA